MSYDELVMFVHTRLKEEKKIREDTSSHNPDYKTENHRIRWTFLPLDKFNNLILVVWLTMYVTNYISNSKTVQITNKKKLLFNLK